MGKVQVLREQVVYAIPESVSGVAVYPTTSTVPILCTAMPDINQDTVKTKSTEIIPGSRGTVDTCVGKTNPGAWSMAYLDRHAGKGVAPVGSAILKNILGSETIVGATSAEYEPALAKGSMTICTLNGTFMRAAVGATVGSYSINTDKECFLNISASGKFMKEVYADRSPLAAAATTATLTVADARKYSVGGVVCIRAAATEAIIDDKAGVGFKITAVNYTSNTITLDGIPSGGAVDDYVDGFLPFNAVAGTLINARGSSVTLNSVVTGFRSIAFTITDADDFLDDEVTASGYPEDYAPGEKEVTAQLTLIARKGDAKYITDMNLNTDVVVSIVNTTGALTKTTTLERCQITSVGFSGDGSKVAVNVSFMCNETVANDSISIKYH